MSTGCISSLQAGAAAMLSVGSLSGVALANEFDLMSSPTPTRGYIIDDAGVLNRTTKKSLTDDLTKLEVTVSVFLKARLATKDCLEEEAVRIDVWQIQ